MIKQYPLRIESELKEKLDELAKNDLRSFNSFANKILLEYCERVEERIVSENESSPRKNNVGTMVNWMEIR